MSAGLQQPGSMEIALAVLITFLFGCDILRQFLNSATGQPSALFRLASLALYGVTGLLLLPHLREVWRHVVRAPMLALFLLAPMLSTFWSTSPSDTAIRGFTLLASSLLGYYLAIRFPPRLLIRVVAMAGVLVAIVSYLLIFGMPSAGRHTDGDWSGTWRGAYLHKNALGGGMAFYCSFMILILMTGRQAERALVILGLLICAGLLIGARSATGQIAFVVGIAAVIALRTTVIHLRPYVLAGLVVLTPLLLLPLFALDGNTLENFVDGIGKDASFSGRVPLWLSTWPFVQAKLWLGYGYEAFWVDTQTAVRIIALRIFYRPFYSHNGILELMLSLGLVGLVIFAGLLLRFIWRLTQLLWREPRSLLASMCVVFAIGFFVRNVTEVAILTRNELIWCLFVAFYLKLSEASIRVPAAGASMPRRWPAWRHSPRVSVPYRGSRSLHTT